MTKSLVNGLPQETVSVRDRGLQYGDGLFETMAVIGGEIRRLDLHLRRLELGCARLGIPSPPREVLFEELLSISGAEDRKVVKLVVTRGVRGRGYQTEEGIEPTRVVSLHEWPAYPAHWSESGVAVRWCQTTLAEQPLLAGIKHLNRLEQVLARREWTNAEIAEGLMCDAHGRVVGGTMTNLFVVLSEEVVTPRVDRCGVAGTTRAAVMSAARDFGVAVVEKELSRAEVENAREVFLTNALIGIWPVREIEGQRFPIGPVTRRMQHAL